MKTQYTTHDQRNGTRKDDARRDVGRSDGRWVLHSYTSRASAIPINTVSNIYATICFCYEPKEQPKIKRSNKPTSEQQTTTKTNHTIFVCILSFSVSLSVFCILF